MKLFSDFAVPVDNIIGFGSDGCSTMMGANNSVSSRFKRFYLPESEQLNREVEWCCFR